MPVIIPAENLFMALIIGGASGLSATGANQIIKQLGQFEEDRQEQQKAKLEISDDDKSEH